MTKDTVDEGAPLMERDLDEIDAKKKSRAIAECNRLMRKLEELRQVQYDPATGRVRID